MDRRSFIRLLVTGVVGAELDLDRLLWVPGEKKIFIPSPKIHHVTLEQVITIEKERVIPHIRTLFENDSLFYTQLHKTRLFRIGDE